MNGKGSVKRYQSHQVRKCYSSTKYSISLCDYDESHFEFLLYTSTFYEILTTITLTINLVECDNTANLLYGNQYSKWLGDS